MRPEANKEKMRPEGEKKEAVPKCLQVLTRMPDAALGVCSEEQQKK